MFVEAIQNRRISQEEGVLKIKGHTCIAVTHNLKGLQLISGHFLFGGNLKSLLC